MTRFSIWGVWGKKLKVLTVAILYLSRRREMSRAWVAGLQER